MATLREAAQSMSRRDVLCTLRDIIAGQIDSCESGRDMAALTKRFMEVCDEIENLPREGGEQTAWQRKKAEIEARRSGGAA